MDKELLEAVVTGFVKHKSHSIQDKVTYYNIDATTLVSFFKRRDTHQPKGKNAVYYYYINIENTTNYSQIQLNTEKEMDDLFDFIHKVIYLRGLRALKNS